MTSNSSRTLLFALAAAVIMFILCLCSVSLMVVRNSFVYIAPDERGIVTRLNQPTGRILEPGKHFIAPGQQVVIFYIGRQTYEMSAASAEKPNFIEATTSDGQKIQVDISAVYAVDPDQVINVYIMWGDQYTEFFVRPMILAVTHNTLMQYTFEEIRQNQEEIKQIIFDQLTQDLAESYLILVEYNFLDIRKNIP